MGGVCPCPAPPDEGPQRSGTNNSKPTRDGLVWEVDGGINKNQFLGRSNDLRKKQRVDKGAEAKAGNQAAAKEAAVTAAAAAKQRKIDSIARLDLFEAPLRDIIDFCTLFPNLSKVNAKNRYEQTPLHLVAQTNEVHTKAAIESLLSARADIAARNVLGITPITNAAEVSSFAAIETLLEHRADVNSRDSYLQSPLYVACVEADGPTMQLLLDARANPSAEDCDGSSCLLRAITYESESQWHNSAGAVKLLLTAKADVHAVQEATGQTALFSAACVGNYTVLPLLIAAGADVNHQNQRGCTGLDVAKGFENQMRILDKTQIPPEYCHLKQAYFTQTIMLLEDAGARTHHYERYPNGLDGTGW